MSDQHGWAPRPSDPASDTQDDTYVRPPVGDRPAEVYRTVQVAAEVIPMAADAWDRLYDGAREAAEEGAREALTQHLRALVARAGFSLVPGTIAFQTLVDDRAQPPSLPGLHVARIRATAQAYDPDDPR